MVSVLVIKARGTFSYFDLRLLTDLVCTLHRPHADDMASAKAKRQCAQSNAVSREAAKHFWTGGRSGTLSAKAQSQVWALTTMSNKFGLKVTQSQIAKEVHVIGKKRKHPCVSSIEQWQAQFKDDGTWYPNKHLIEQDSRPVAKARRILQYKSSIHKKRILQKKNINE